MLNFLNSIMSLSLMAEGGLEIKLIEIALHVLNLIILIIFLKMLVYNPTIKFIEKRRNHFSEMVDENKRLTTQVEEIKTKSDDIIADARKSAEYIGLQATKEAELKGREILKEAKDKSDAIISRTKKEMEKEKQLLHDEVKLEVVDLAIDVASKVLAREVTVKDNQTAIDESLKEWGNK